ncbi:hypothetical protein A2U01_0027404 [Trifolium medium]|uniref:Uncharacterized protein n=1 Tax=Trifolium medium TaxID=97028 RepID=A0A392P681_9FABA|nr:hypothetical protein [Trifolium medium]
MHLQEGRNGKERRKPLNVSITEWRSNKGRQNLLWNLRDYLSLESAALMQRISANK